MHLITKKEYIDMYKKMVEGTGSNFYYLENMRFGGGWTPEAFLSDSSIPDVIECCIYTEDNGGGPGLCFDASWNNGHDGAYTWTGFGLKEEAKHWFLNMFDTRDYSFKLHDLGVLDTNGAVSKASMIVSAVINASSLNRPDEQDYEETSRLSRDKKYGYVHFRDGSVEFVLITEDNIIK